MAAVSFLFDLGSPYAYLAAERVDRVFDGVEIEWQPILLGGLFALTGRSSWAAGDPDRRRAGMAEVEARAAAYGLPAVRWPERWPGNYLYAMRAATYAAGQGLARPFALAALRSAFREGTDLSDAAAVLAAAGSAGLDPERMAAAVASPGVKAALRQATEAAHGAGVFGVPTVLVAGEVFWGDDRLEAAARRAGR